MKFFLFSILALCSFFLSEAQIKHIEPLNWWVGMKNPDLQIMVNGNNISNTEVSISYPGVKVKNTIKGDSENYLFINLIIAANTIPGKFNISFLRNGKLVDKVEYELKSRSLPANGLQGFNSSDVICLITPDRFANGDTANDIIPGAREVKVNRNFQGGRHGGDIRGMINGLDYLKGMGYTAIWPQPLVENDMPSYSYHGYAITDHYKVDPRFGTLDEYKELASKARQKGIKLIYDAVLNHIGSSHWWMQDLPFKNWINFPDSKQQTTHVRTTNQDPNASQYDKNLMTRGWFVETMPDLNGEHPLVANYLIQNNIWWIETLQLGGIRLDTYGYSVKSLLDNWACRIMKEYPNFSLVGEEWSLNPLITSYWQAGKHNHDGYSGCLGSTMDFPLQSALIESLRQKDRSIWGKGLNLLYELLANDFIYSNPNKLLVFADNHDMDRIYTQLGNDLQLTQMAFTCLLTLRGIPQIYYGSEVLLNNSTHLGDHGFIRTDMPGGWNGDSSNAFTAKGLSGDQLSMQAYLKFLMNWRKTNKAIQSGKTLHFAPFDDLYVYFRYTEKEKVMVILNRNEKVMSMSTNRFNEILDKSSFGREIFSGSVIDLSQSVKIPAKSAMVIEIQ